MHRYYSRASRRHALALRVTFRAARLAHAPRTLCRPARVAGTPSLPSHPPTHAPRPRHPPTPLTPPHTPSSHPPHTPPHAPRSRHAPQCSTCVALLEGVAQGTQGRTRRLSPFSSATRRPHPLRSPCTWFCYSGCSSHHLSASPHRFLYPHLSGETCASFWQPPPPQWF